VPTPDHFIPLLYVAGLADAAGSNADVLTEGYTYGSLSMTSYTLGAGRRDSPTQVLPPPRFQIPTSCRPTTPIPSDRRCERISSTDNHCCSTTMVMTTVSSPPRADGDARRRSVVLAICCLSVFMAGLDTTIVNVALPSIQRSLHASVSGLQWTIDAYTLVIACLLMLSGSLADRFGRRRSFRLGWRRSRWVRWPAAWLRRSGG